MHFALKVSTHFNNLFSCHKVSPALLVFNLHYFLLVKSPLYDSDMLKLSLNKGMTTYLFYFSLRSWEVLIKYGTGLLANLSVYIGSLEYSFSFLRLLPWTSFLLGGSCLIVRLQKESIWVNLKQWLSLLVQPGILIVIPETPTMDLFPSRREKPASTITQRKHLGKFKAMTLPPSATWYTLCHSSDFYHGPLSF